MTQQGPFREVIWSKGIIKDIYINVFYLFMNISYLQEGVMFHGFTKYHYCETFYVPHVIDCQLCGYISG